MNVLGWTERQWDIAFEWYALKTGQDAPPRDLAGCIAVNAEWQRRGKPHYGPTHDTVRTIDGERVPC